MGQSPEFQASEKTFGKVAVWFPLRVRMRFQPGLPWHGYASLGRFTFLSVYQDSWVAQLLSSLVRREVRSK